MFSSKLFTWERTHAYLNVDSILGSTDGIKSERLTLNNCVQPLKMTCATSVQPCKPLCNVYATAVNPRLKSYVQLHETLCNPVKPLYSLVWPLCNMYTILCNHVQPFTSWYTFFLSYNPSTFCSHQWHLKDSYEDLLPKFS